MAFMECQLRYDISSSFGTDLSQRVDAVKDENLKLKSENQVSRSSI